MLTILMGKSGTGKDMLQGLLMENGYIPLVSTTSRPMREGETQGVEYNFISREKFLQDIQDEKFLEYRSYNTLVEGKPDTWYYGMPKETLKNMEKGGDYITILDTAGTKDFLEYLGRDACFICYIDTPDELREERAKNRGGFDKTEWDRRLHDDAVRFSEEKIGELANARLYNEGLSPKELMDLFYRSMREYCLTESEYHPADNERNKENAGKPVQRVAVTWEMCGFVDIPADSIEEAMEIFNNTSDHIPLPKDAEYIDGSFTLSSEDAQEMEAMNLLEEDDGYDI